uniref:CBM20 domain-containing protein n=1 Tax=Alexandrium monilatum TaxID=311494 RepID=A0A7S4UEM9_9DINO|mmetsp:Transcript_8511/g.25803  ORF Transcript_8511/g.25803 Transcript_8511/m.25803 type:complete len:558 (+) Transcript_8511:103-1776(+)
MATTTEDEAGGAGTAAAPPTNVDPPADAAAEPESGKQLVPATPAKEEPPKQLLCVGDRVVIQGMVENEKLNGTGGILVAMTGDRWQVRLDGKGRWLVKTVHLMKVDVPTVDLREHAICIVGTFDNWADVHEMSWDAECKCYHYEIKLGSDKEESFQIVLNKDWKRCLHPDKNDANPYSAYNLLGPDDRGHQLNWTIGKHACDQAAVGARYRVSLSIHDDGNPKKINWTRLADGATAAAAVPASPTNASATSSAAVGTATQAEPTAAVANGPAEGPTCSRQVQPAEAAVTVQLPKYKSVCIVGEFNEWKNPVAMKWDESRRCYHHRIKLGYSKQESFQMLVDGDWTKCVHPDEPDGSFRMGSIVCGPDDDGHDKNWTIGLDTRDKPARGVEYEVRLVLKDDGTPDAVDWLRLDKSGNYEPVPEPPAPVKLPEHKGVSIIGEWTNWKPQDMKWDVERRCYHVAVSIGRQRQESFQLLLDGDFNKCLHPSCEDGSPFTENRICGPDNRGHGKNWTIGLHFLERADDGSRFEIRLFLTDDGAARLVDWVRIRPGVVGRAAR